MPAGIFPTNYMPIRNVQKIFEVDWTFQNFDVNMIWTHPSLEIWKTYDFVKDFPAKRNYAWLGNP